MAEVPIMEYLDVKGLVEPIIENSDVEEREAKRISTQAAKMLIKLVNSIEHSSKDRFQDILRSIKLCVECLIVRPVKWNNPVDLERNITRAVYNFQKHKFTKGAVELADVLFRHVTVTGYETGLDNLATSIKTVYGCLWNAALEENSTALCLQLRLTAIKLLCLGEHFTSGKLAGVREKFGQALNVPKLDVSKKAQSSEIKTCCELVNNTCIELCDWFIDNRTKISVNKNNKCHLSNSKSVPSINAEKNIDEWTEQAMLVMRGVLFLMQCQLFKESIQLLGKCSERLLLYIASHREQSSSTECKFISGCLEAMQMMNSILKSRLVVLGSSTNQDVTDDKGKTLKMDEELFSTLKNACKFISDLEKEISQSAKAKPSDIKICVKYSKAIVTLWPPVLASLNQNFVSTSKADITPKSFLHLSKRNQAKVEEMYDIMLRLLRIELYSDLQSLKAIPPKQEPQRKEWEKVVKKSKHLQIEYIQTCTDLMNVQMGIMSQEKGISAVNKRSFRVAEHLSDVIKSMRGRPPITITEDEHLHFGLLTYQLGRLCYSEADYTGSIFHHKLSCEHLTTWARDTSSERLAKESLFKRFDSLAQAYRRVGQYEAAQDTIVTALLVQGSSVVETCESWLALKLDAAKNKEAPEELQRRVLWNALVKKAEQDKVTLPERLNATSVLEAELNATRLKDGLSFDAKLSILEKYSSVLDGNPLKKARLDLELAQVLWRKRVEHNGRTAEDIVKAVLVSMTTEEKRLGSGAGLGGLARAHLLLYVITDVNVLDIKRKAEERKAKREQLEKQQQRVRDVEPEDIKDDELYIESTPICSEKILQEHVLEALRCWKRLAELQPDGVLGAKEKSRDTMDMINDMLLLATIFRLSHKHKEMCETIHLLLPLSVEAKHHQSFLRASTMLAQYLNENKQPAAALVFLNNCEGWVRDYIAEKRDKIQASGEYIYMVAVRAETLLLLNQVEEGFRTLEHSIELKKMYKRERSKEDLQLEGYIRRAHARFASLPKSFWTQGGGCGDELALAIMMRGVRSICGVVNASLGAAFISSVDNAVAPAENVTEKWFLLCELLDTFAEVGAVYCELGDGREARTHLNQGLILAQAFHLSKRLALFHLLLARLDNVSGKYRDAIAHLNAVHYILHSQSHHQNIPGSLLDKLKQEPAQIQDTPTKFQIKSKPLDFEDHLDLEDERPTDGSPASPKHKKDQVTVPEFWQHSDDCGCDTCADVEVTQLSFMYVLAFCELYTFQNQRREANRYLQLAVGRFDKLSKLCSNHLQSYLRSFIDLTKLQNSPLRFVSNISNLTSDTENKENRSDKGDAISNDFLSKTNADFKNLKVQHSSLHGHFIEACKLVTYLALVNLDLKKHSTWTKRMQACLDLRAHPWMVTSHVNMAEAGYLDSVPSLPWPQPRKEEERILNDILTGITKISLMGDNAVPTEGTSTPMAENKAQSRIPSAVAPIKKRRGRPPPMLINFDTPVAESDSKVNSESKPVTKIAPSDSKVNFESKPVSKVAPVAESAKAKPKAAKGASTRTAPLAPRKTRSAKVSGASSKFTVYEDKPNATSVTAKDTEVTSRGAPKRTSGKVTNKCANDTVTKKSTKITKGNIAVVPDNLSMDNTNLSTPVKELYPKPTKSKVTNKPNAKSNVKSETNAEKVKLKLELLKSIESAPSTPVLGIRTFNSQDTPSTVRGQFVMTSYKMSTSVDDVSIEEVVTENQKAKIVIDGPDVLKMYLYKTFCMLAKKPPSIPYAQVCQALARLCLYQHDTQEAVYYLTEAHSVIFRHNALLNISKKIRKMNSAQDSSTDFGQEASPIEEKLNNMADTLAFDKTQDDIKEAVKALPEGWSVCQISVVHSPDKDCGDMILTSLHNSPAASDIDGGFVVSSVVQRLAGYSSVRGQKVLKEFTDIMTESLHSMEITESAQWWTKRRALDQRVKDFLSDLDAYWLSCWRCLLVGLPANKKTRHKLEELVNEIVLDLISDLPIKPSDSVKVDIQSLVKVILNGTHLLWERELIQIVIAAVESSGQNLPKIEEIISKYVDRIREKSKQLDLESEERLPVILILDKSVQHLPWESLSFVKKHTLSRVPSLYFLHGLLRQQTADASSAFSRGVDPCNTYYVLNPENNLPSTEQKFKDTFNQLKGWHGITGKVPTVTEYSNALVKNDLFVYCGHGGGGRYISGAMLQALHCHACVLLMGCSSGKLTVHGSLEASGLILYYFLAGSPCIIANLWDVTDKDIDRFTDKLIKCWLDAKNGSDMCSFMSESRDCCRLPSLIGAAPVVYGIPLSIRR